MRGKGQVGKEGLMGRGRGEKHKSTEEKASVTRKQGPTNEERIERREGMGERREAQNYRRKKGINDGKRGPRNGERRRGEGVEGGDSRWLYTLLTLGTLKSCWALVTRTVAVMPNRD